MSPELEKIVKTLGNAKCPEDVFGDIKEWKSNFRAICLVCHPDRYKGKEDKVWAEKYFKILECFYSDAKAKILRNTYGKKECFVQNVKITSKSGGEYELTEKLYSGDLSDLYLGKQKFIENVVKIARNPRNNDLLVNEANVLNAIKRGPAKEFKSLKHIPVILDSFQILDKKIYKQVNVLKYDKDFISLEQVIEKFPNGIDIRDAAWMFNRLLAALITIHQSGYVHGAVLPCHVLINPKNHDGILIDYSYSCKIGEKLKAIVPKYKGKYPIEVGSKPVTVATDIYMAAKILQYLVFGKLCWVPNKIPKPISNFIKSILIVNPLYRPNDSFEVFKEFGGILKECFGEPKFREFKI